MRHQLNVVPGPRQHRRRHRHVPLATAQRRQKLVVHTNLEAARRGWPVAPLPSQRGRGWGGGLPGCNQGQGGGLPGGHTARRPLARAHPRLDRSIRNAPRRLNRRPISHHPRQVADPRKHHACLHPRPRRVRTPFAPTRKPPRHARGVQAELHEVAPHLAGRQRPRRKLGQHQRPVPLDVVGEQRRPLPTARRVLMFDNRARHVLHRPPAQSQSPRQVEVLVIHEVPLVEVPNLVERRLPQDRRRPAEEEHLVWGVVAPVVRFVRDHPVRHDGPAVTPTAVRQHHAARVLDPPGVRPVRREDELRGARTGTRIRLHRRHEGAQPPRAHPRIRVQQHDVRPRRVAHRRVVPTPKAPVGRVASHAHPRVRTLDPRVRPVGRGVIDNHDLPPACVVLRTAEGLKARGQQASTVPVLDDDRDERRRARARPGSPFPRRDGGRIPG